MAANRFDPVLVGEHPPAAAASELEHTVRSLSRCADDALSKAVCEGIIDPKLVVGWVQRAVKLVLYQRNEAELRSEVSALVQHLQNLLSQVGLAGRDPIAIARSVVGRLPAVRALLAEDVEAAFEGDPAAKSFAEIVSSYPSLRALSVHRISHELYRLGVPLLPRIMSEHAHDRTGIDIHPGARVGRRFFIDHGTGVVVGETTEIGHDVRIYQGVTLGARSPRHGESLRGVKRHPTIEDDVTIYAGATILGGDTVVGAGSVIGGNVWLVESVPPGSKVLAESPNLQVRRRGRTKPQGHQLEWDI